MIHEFPCGNLPLDFAGTLRARRREEPIDFMPDEFSLNAWLEESGLRTGGAAATASDYQDALHLREAIYAAAWSRLHQLAVPEETLASLNSRAAEPGLVLSLGAGPGINRTGSTSQALSDIARAAIEVLGGSDTGFLRECSAPDCTQIYLDHSRGRRREWCSMQSCGSRAKAAAYRARKKAERENGVQPATI